MFLFLLFSVSFFVCSPFDHHNSTLIIHCVLCFFFPSSRCVFTPYSRTHTHVYGCMYVLTNLAFSFVGKHVVRKLITLFITFALITSIDPFGELLLSPKINYASCTLLLRLLLPVFLLFFCYLLSNSSPLRLCNISLYLYIAYVCTNVCE